MHHPMESSGKSRRGADRADGTAMRIRSVDVDLDPPPDGIEQVEQEDLPHVIQIMVAAWKARGELPIGWSVTPQISGIGRTGSIKTGYEARIWGWSNMSLAEILRARDGSNQTYLKDMFIDFDYACPNGENRGCLRLVISSQAGENARQIAQPITQAAIEAGTTVGTAPPPPAPSVMPAPNVPVPPLDLGAPAAVGTPPPPPTAPPPPVVATPSRKRTLLGLIGFG